MGRVDGARAFQMRQGRLQLALLHQERRELILRLEAVRMAADRFRQRALGCGGLGGLRRAGLRLTWRGRLSSDSRSCQHDEHEREEHSQLSSLKFQVSESPVSDVET